MLARLKLIFVYCAVLIVAATADESPLPVLKRPECAQKIESEVLGGRYEVFPESGREGAGSNDFTDGVNVVSLEDRSDGDDMENIMRSLPEQTFLSIVS